MAIDTIIPVNVSPEVAAHAQRLGMEAVLDRLIEHTRQTVTGLQRIRVELDPPHDTGGDDAMVVEAVRDPAQVTANDPTTNEWGRWFVTTFPPEVRQHFSFLTVYGTSHAR